MTIPGWRVLSGVTLIELLAVLAIVAVLAVLAAVSLRGILERSKAAKCTSNLRQIAVATSLYTGENNGALPITGTPPFASPPWYNPLAPYLGLKMRAGSIIALDPQNAVANRVLQSPSYSGPPREVSYAPSVTWANQRTVNIPVLSKKIWVVTSTDSYSVNPSGLQRFGFGFPGGRAQVVYFDGRAEMLERSQLQALGSFPFNLFER